jgi:hypothetical protein
MTLSVNARLQPPAPRTARIERDARLEVAPTFDWEPWSGLNRSRFHRV